MKLRLHCYFCGLTITARKFLLFSLSFDETTFCKFVCCDNQICKEKLGKDSPVLEVRSE